MTLIDGQTAIDALSKLMVPYGDGSFPGDDEKAAYDEAIVDAIHEIENLPSAQPMLSESDRTICKMYLNDRDEFKTCNEYKMLMRLIDNSAQPKSGEWEYHSNPTIGINPETAYCSCCGFSVDTTGNIDFDEYNFCPRCGAKMER